MEKQSASNFKISRAILCMIFSILFILTALNISTPLTAYAEETSLGQVLNLGSFSANETDESSNEQAGYLYWAASGERSGIYYYVQSTCVSSYILYECGKARNICRNIEIFNGTYRYKCYLKCVYTP